MHLEICTAGWWMVVEEGSCWTGVTSATRPARVSHQDCEPNPHARRRATGKRQRSRTPVMYFPIRQLYCYISGACLFGPLRYLRRARPSQRKLLQWSLHSFATPMPLPVQHHCGGDAPDFAPSALVYEHLRARADVSNSRLSRGYGC